MAFHTTRKSRRARGSHGQVIVTATPRLALHVSTETLAGLRRHAWQRDTTVSAVIRLALDSWLRSQNQFLDLPAILKGKAKTKPKTKTKRKTKTIITPFEGIAHESQERP